MRLTFVFGGIAMLLYLAFFDPQQWPAPQCLFRQLTHLDCPGCGTQRAVHAAFSGDFSGAWHYNPALFFALPLAAVYAWSPKRLEKVLYSPFMLAAIVTAIVAWWILRNTVAQG